MGISRVWTYDGGIYWQNNVWKHIIWVIMPKTSAKLTAEWHVYFDGVLTLTHDGYYPRSGLMSGWIGKDAGNSNPYVGYMDSFMVFPMALHWSEAQEIYMVICMYVYVHVCMYVHISIGLCELE